eukprot:scaffold34_cov337-Pavlova_lutheri.AAC.8
MAPRSSTPDLVILMKVPYLSVFPFPGFDGPVPRGRSAALGEVLSSGAVWGPHHLPVVFRL